MAIRVDETRAYFPRPVMPSTLNRGPRHRKSRAALVRERPGRRLVFFPKIPGENPKGNQAMAPIRNYPLVNTQKAFENGHL